MKIIDAMKLMNISPGIIAQKLDISTSQIYYWNRNGISINNKYYSQLKEMLPELTPKEATLRLDEEEDRRYNSGRKKQNKLKLTETNIEAPKETDFTSTLFPRIIKRKQAD